MLKKKNEWNGRKPALNSSALSRGLCCVFQVEEDGLGEIFHSYLVKKKKKGRKRKQQAKLKASQSVSYR